VRVDDESLSSPSGTAWNDSRVALRDRLTRYHPVVGDVYASAVDQLGRPPTVGRMTMLAHGVRELTNELAAKLAASEGQPLSSRADRDDAAATVADVWIEHGLPVPAAPQDAVTDPRAESVQAIPEPVFVAVQGLVIAHNRASESAGRSRAVVVGARAAVTDAAVQRLRDVWNFFRPYFHLHRGKEMSLPDEDELQRRFEELELVVNARLAPFFDVVQDLDEILGEANRRRGPELTNG
jgi:hypothetical protein